MKKILYFAFAALLMAGMVACEDDNQNNPTPNNPDNPDGPTVDDGVLTGTEWVYDSTGTEIMYDTVDNVVDTTLYGFEVSINISFTSATAGLMDVAMVMTIDGEPFMDTSDDDPSPFTYTYDGTATSGRGTMNGTDEDGHPVQIPFIVNGNTLSIEEVDDETGEPVIIVLTRK